ncbi:MAG TPA: DUF4350 domain-containing protein [Longimicrobium sp.]|uniref:DUF4350 domain-containing protein n=1 Tax=Longimicrobium sp. TaxID=2029185 RepID=UPI002ED89056
MGRRDTALVFLLIAILIALSAVAGRRSARDDTGDPRASTFIRSEGGLAALYWTLQELGIPVARRTDPMLHADSIRGALAIVAPWEHPSEEEMSAIREHVERGGTLLFVPGGYDFAGPAYDTLGLRPVWIEGVSPWGDDGRAATPPAAHRWTEGVRQVEGFRRAFADTSRALRRPGAETLLAADGHPVAVTWPLGKGRVLAIADGRPLTNKRLRESGAALLAARAVAEAGDTLFFDEYHQGFSGRGSLVGGTLGMIRRFVSGAAAIQLLVAVALLLWVGGRRFGAPLQPPPARRRSPLEHVEALAGAYRQAGARRTVRRLLLAGLARRLGRRVPPDERAAGEMLDRMARQSPTGRDAAAALEGEWKRGQSGDLVALTRGVDRLLDEVRR